MRKHFFIFGIVATMFVNIAFAQIADINVMEKKGTVLSKDFDINFIGCDGQQSIFVQNTALFRIGSGKRLGNKKVLVSYDMNQEELARVLLIENESNLKCYGGYLNGKNVDLLMVEKKDYNMRVYRDRRDFRSLEPKGAQQVLAEFSGSKGDDLMFLCKTSPDGNLLAGLYVVDRENQNTELQVALYNKELDEYWKMDSRCRGLSFMHVTDSGEVLLGANTEDGKFRVFVIDGENEEMYDFDINTDNLSDVMVTDYADGKIFIAATHSNKDNSNSTISQADYIMAICYNTRNHDVTTDKHFFTKEECNRMDNENDEKKIRKDDFRINYLCTKQTLPDKDGCYAMFDQSWIKAVNNVPSEYNRWGMMVARINRNGKFEWVKIVRIANSCDYISRTLIGYRWIPTDKGILLVWAANEKNESIPEEKQIKSLYVCNKKVNINMLRMDSRGNETRQIYPLDSRYGLVGFPHYFGDNQYLLLISGAFKGVFATMKLK